MADTYPSAEVVGVDLSPIQTVWVPPNAKFLVDDIEDEWLHGSDFDLVHLRCIIPWMKQLDVLLGRIHELVCPVRPMSHRSKHGSGDEPCLLTAPET